METTIKLLPPHSAKQRILICYDGNVAAFCGRRWGKTDGYVQRIYYWMQRKPGLYWWVGLSWRSASMKRAWRNVTHIARLVLRGLDKDPRQYINRTRSEIKLPGLGEIWFRTGDNPTSLAGEGIRGAIVDEFSLLPEVVWAEFLEATLLDYGGWVGFGGVPKGNNWAAKLWRQAAVWDGWQQIHATSYENPFLDSRRIDEIKSHSTIRYFDQEYLAKVVADEGVVFGNIEANLYEGGDTPDDHKGHTFVAGLDWGQRIDWTALSIACVDCMREVELDRFQGMMYPAQRARIKAKLDYWNVSYLLAESNAMGQPNIEDMQLDGIPVEGFQTTAASKPPLIESLALSLEQEEVQWLDDLEGRLELESYERDVSPNTGRPRYNAPEGTHDDTVMARALVRKALDIGGPWAVLI